MPAGLLPPATRPRGRWRRPAPVGLPATGKIPLRPGGRSCWVACALSSRGSSKTARRRRSLQCCRQPVPSPRQHDGVYKPCRLQTRSTPVQTTHVRVATQIRSAVVAAADGEAPAAQARAWQPGWQTAAAGCPCDQPPPDCCALRRPKGFKDSGGLYGWWFECRKHLPFI